MFYYELQFNFNESYFYVQSLLKNKSEKLFRYITLKMKLKFINTWITCFQYAAMVIVPLLLVILYMYKYFENMRAPEKITYDFSEYINTLPKSEFIENELPSEGSLTDGGFISALFKNVLRFGFIPPSLESSIYSYFIFSFYLSWSIVSTIGLLYYRKFKTV
mmetsp:Transcript_21985/g.21706  ORF Transcript_21985/g.21706 Transcript_21985/m.21706 type:complete len:162 (-) Transcript_21985:9-494(-)